MAFFAPVLMGQVYQIVFVFAKGSSFFALIWAIFSLKCIRRVFALECLRRVTFLHAKKSHQKTRWGGIFEYPSPNPSLSDTGGVATPPVNPLGDFVKVCFSGLEIFCAWGYGSILFVVMFLCYNSIIFLA